MSGTSAVNLFSEWAKLNRDEGMERGHSASVDAIIAAVKGRLPSEFTAIDLDAEMDGLFVDSRGCQVVYFHQV